MLRLTTFSRGLGSDDVLDGSAGLEAAWTGRRKLFGLLSDASEPVAAKDGPGIMLVTRAAYDGHGPELEALRLGGSVLLLVEPDGSLSPFPEDDADGPPPEDPLGPDAPLVTTTYPDWFLALPIERLSLPSRLGEAMAGAATIGDLLPLKVSLVTGHGRLGTGAVQRLRRRVAAAYLIETSRMAPPVPRPAPEPYDPSEPLRDHLIRHVGRFQERDAEIVTARLGLDGSIPTLTAMAERLGISRERVRQIQERVLGRIDRTTGFERAIGDDLRSLAEDGPFPLGAVLERPWAIGLAPAVAAQLMERCAGLHAVAVRPGDERACPFGQALWDEGAHALVRLLAAADPDAPASSALAPFAERYGPGPERDGMLALAALAFDMEGGALRALALRGCWPEALGRVVAGGSSAVHVGAIRATLQRHGVEGLLSPRRMEEILRELAIHLGEGLYVPVDGRPPRLNILDRCERILRSGHPGRRWTTEEIAAELAGPEGGRPPEIAQVEEVLARSGRFERVRPRLWRAPEASGDARTIQDVVWTILEERGEPMAGPDIIAEITRRWGRRRFPQIQPDRRICLVDRAVWGLVDRDIRIPPDRRLALVAACVAEFEKGHETLEELMGALGGACREAGVRTTQMLGTVLRVDAGYAVNAMGRLRAPTQAAQPRAGSMRAAIRDILAESPGGISRRGVCAGVHARIGLHPSDAIASKALREYGRRIGKGLWVLAGGNAAAAR